MTEIIHVQPRRDVRVAFARWAVAQQPKVRTVSADAFGVPAHLFTDMPEGLLRGSLVDGHPYVSPLDHEEETEPAPPGAPELTGVAGPRLLSCGLCYEESGEEVHPHPECPERNTLDGLQEAAPGQPLPEVPDSAYGPDSGPVPVEFAPLEDAPTEGEPSVVLVGETGPETIVPLGDNRGDTPGDVLTRGEDTDGTTPAVTSEDTPGDTGDTTGDTGGDSDSGDPAGEPHSCPRCPRSFTTSRGLEVHSRRAHPED
jgi:hypothetical protein